jgi:hypothetical protein
MLRELVQFATKGVYLPPRRQRHVVQNKLIQSSRGEYTVSVGFGTLRHAGNSGCNYHHDGSE